MSSSTSPPGRECLAGALLIEGSRRVFNPHAHHHRIDTAQGVAIDADRGTIQYWRCLHLRHPA
jgi:hypothetical protein